MDALDFKKAYKELYQPKATPELIEVPAASYVAVRGHGDPNEEGGAYQQAVGLLYAISYAIKMSYKGSRKIEGFYPYVVPPLEGLWWRKDGAPGVDYGNKAAFCWISMIRLPEFVNQEVLEWAKAEVAQKKGVDVEKAELLTLKEGLCCQCMHLGGFDDEPVTMARMEEFIRAGGCRTDHSEIRRHHEIYLSDPRKTPAEKCRTVLRVPVARL